MVLIPYKMWHRFQDMPYLDLSSHQRKLDKRRSESDEDADSDRMSLCSMDSSFSMVGPGVLLTEFY